ncbi:hypothetical protein EKO04_006113 [Ascochyta lentis]|uniref:Uncharacterized protein n=1 Tax=Ascochyta lentis TaxID=205686 RepID=A0A8H7MI20_9PLEO|nr:hypothetical protein EKO04_006113 [Ascochyta lentis]
MNMASWSQLLFFSSAGTEYLVLPSSSLQIQLPCHERYFETDAAVKTGFLNDKKKPLSEPSLSSLMLRTFDIWDQVLQNAKLRLESSTKPTPGGERSDSDESIPQLAEYNGTHPPVLERGLDQSTLVNPPLLDNESILLPEDDTGLFWPYLGALEPDSNLIPDPNNGLLWDWADALGPTIPR